MKKKLELLMAALMLCSVTACMGSDKPKDDKKDKDKIAIVDKDENKDKQEDKEKIKVKDENKKPSKEDKKEETKPSEKPADKPAKPSNPTPPIKPVEPEKPVTPPTKPAEPEKPVEPPKPQEPYIVEDGRDHSWWPDEYKNGWHPISLQSPIFDTEQQAWNWAMSVWEEETYTEFGFSTCQIKYSNGSLKWSIYWYVPN